MDTSTRNIDVDRLQREKEYHNSRFTHEVREAQGKFYFSIKVGATRFSELVYQHALNGDVLEYGCGDNSFACNLASTARSVSGIDISDVAIDAAEAEAARRGLDNVRFLSMNAEQLDYEDDSFDFIFGRGIIHHLDLDRSYAEISRVLRPNGKALFWEPLGHNVLINLYRRLTPEARTVDEHPLLKSDFTLARKYFDSVSVQHYGLTTLASTPWRDTPVGERILKVTSSLDRALFVVPELKWQAWYCIMELAAPTKSRARV